jgi:hypothetical protein
MHTSLSFASCFYDCESWSNWEAVQYYCVCKQRTGKNWAKGNGMNEQLGYQITRNFVIYADHLVYLREVKSSCDVLYL